MMGWLDDAPGCTGYCGQGRAKLCPHPQECGVEPAERKLKIPPPPGAKVTMPTRGIEDPTWKYVSVSDTPEEEAHIAKRFDAYRSICGTLPKDEEGEPA